MAHFFGLRWPKLGPMNALPLQFLMLIIAGWVNRQQQEVIEYLEEENRALREQLDGKRLRITDQQRRRLAVKAKAVVGSPYRSASESSKKVERFRTGPILRTHRDSSFKRSRRPRASSVFVGA